ncbi:sulfatase-like hydrolase/transferase [Galbibacter sp. BG1]|uniref:sulfatase family protein n=1 Tax=Galbibacter sp. BG1 TaxID=1170699 RepID=UPI0015BF5EA0|nr:sulfatase-like hydrolase/transferase [Galbibacter sp. BG1]QLE01717.1 sulfatase-like hydrolase/transferase [Galbibacter sp. BG1]
MMSYVRNNGICTCLIAFFSFFLIGCSSEEKKDLKFKHVVVIVGDDHSSNVMGAYGNKKIRTPNLDKLAASGTFFTNAYSNSPLCSASRQSLLTGKYPHATGVNLLFTPFNDKTNTTIAEHLKKENFSTALVGKQHFNSWIWGALYKDKPPSFGFDTLIDRTSYKKWFQKQEVVPVSNTVSTFTTEIDSLPQNIARMNPFSLPHSYHDHFAEGTFLAKSAIDFIEKEKDNRIFLWLAFHEPHAPFAFPVEYQGKYRAENMDLPKGFPEDDRWIPERFKGFSDIQKKGVIASYYTSVEYMDKNIGLVIDALKQKGLYEDTLIIYLGDQGYLLNEHKRFEKHTMWQESIKAPLIVAGGKDIFKGKVIDEVIEFVDIAPFIADMVEAPPMKEAQGISLKSTIEEGTPRPYSYVFAEFLEDNKVMAANKNWKYIFSTGKRDLGQGYKTGNGAYGIHHRLYNLQKDPQESTNLAYEEEMAKKVEEMQDFIIKKFKQTHPYAKELPENLTTVGELVWFCEPRDVGAEYGGDPLKVWYHQP